MAGLSIVHNDDNSGYSTSDAIEAKTNVTGQLTPIAAISPERGTYIRLANRVSKGSAIGLPFYAKFRDQAGNNLPSRTNLAVAIKPLGAKQWLIVSDEIDNISYWNQNSIKTQRDAENVDAVKVPLDYPPNNDADGRPPAVNINGVDEAFVLANSQKQIDWKYSEFYVESNAVSTGTN